jgi:cyclophilin family peptidyl-prolyl cis-trans isomerase
MRLLAAVLAVLLCALASVSWAEDPPSVAALVEQAKERAAAGDLAGASAKLAEARKAGATDADVPPDLAAAVAKWEAPPTLTIDAPSAGAAIQTREFVVKGKFASGRTTDRVLLGETEVPVAEGRFSVTVRTDPTVPEQTFTLRVEDAGVARGAPVSRKVKVALPWARPLRDAIALGTKGDWKGAKAKADQARSAGATDADWPETFGAGLAEYEASVPASGKPTDPALAAIAKAGARVDRKGASWRTSLPKFPEAKFDPKKKYVWELVTNKGKIRVQLMPKVAPLHVANLCYLTLLGFYDETAFHRVIPGFMAQGGDPFTADPARAAQAGSGGPGYSFDGEFDAAVVHDRGGLLSMAHAGPGTDGSQFFLTFAPARHLDGKHTIFGEVVDGMDVLRELEKAGSPSGKTSERLTIVRATVSAK